jgi:hypothetical protein
LLHSYQTQSQQREIAFEAIGAPGTIDSGLLAFALTGAGASKSPAGDFTNYVLIGVADKNEKPPAIKNYIGRLTFLWRTRDDSNVRPLPSEAIISFDCNSLSRMLADYPIRSETKTKAGSERRLDCIGWYSDV